MSENDRKAGWWSTAETAQYLGVDEKTLRELRRALPPDHPTTPWVDLGGKRPTYRWKVDLIDAWFKASERITMPGIVAGIVFTFVPMLGDDVVAKVIGGQQVLMLGGAMLDLITALNYSVAAAMSTFILLIIASLQFLLVLILRRLGGGAALVEGIRQ